MGYTVIGALAGAIPGFLIRRHRLKERPPHERYPADPRMSLKELVVTYVRQSNSVKSAPRTIRVRQGKVFSAIIVETRQRDKVLLPKKYGLSGDPEWVERLKGAYDEGNTSRFAELLSVFPGQLRVLDFIAEETTSGNRLSMEGVINRRRSVWVKWPKYRVSPRGISSSSSGAKKEATRR